MKVVLLLLSAFIFNGTRSQPKCNEISRWNKHPIARNRTISFTTQEGSFMDVAISPNGSEVAFTLLGDLFIVSSKGGKVRQLTKGLGISRCPVWSPNGKLIAYQSDATGFVQLHIIDTIWKYHKIIGEKSFELKIENAFEPKWLDNNWIALGDFLYSLTGVKTVLPIKGKRVYLFSNSAGYIYYGDEDESSHRIVKVFDMNSCQVVNSINLNKFSWTLKNERISPDCNWFTYIKGNLSTSADSLMVINLKTGEERLLAHLNIQFPGYINQQYYCFSSNSENVLIGYGGKIHCINIHNGSNSIVPFKAKVDIEMGKLKRNSFNVSLDSMNVKYIRSIQQNPNGKNIVFSALNKIYTMNFAKVEPHLLIDQPVNQFQPVFSPDGKWIAYVSWTDGEGGYIWRVPSSGGVAEKITKTPGLYQHPAWSPDGNYMVVAKGMSNLGTRDDIGVGQILLLDFNSGKEEVLADKVPLFNNPTFSRDGRRVFFKPNQYGAENKLWPKLISIDIIDKTVKVVAEALVNGINPVRQIIVSPDERYLVFMNNEDIYLTEIPRIGKSVTIIDDKSKISLIRFARGGIDPRFEDDGKTLSWIVTNRYYRINPERIIEAANCINVNKGIDGLPETKIIDVDISPDKVIPVGVKVARAFGKGTLVLNNARIITMGQKEVIENGSMIVSNGRILSVGERDEMKIPKGVTVIDLKGKTIMPGFIDVHSHMYEAVPPDIFLQESWQRLANLAFGITTIRDPSGSHDTFGYNELLETGQIMGPRLFTVGYAVRPFYNLNSINEARLIVNSRANLGAITIKQYNQSTRLQRQLLLSACNEARVNMTNEVEKYPISFIGMVKDGSPGIEHNPIWGDIYSDVIKFVSKSGTYLTPTLQVCYGREDGKYYFRKLFGKSIIGKKIVYFPDRVINQMTKGVEKLDSSFLDQSRIDAAILKSGGKIAVGSHGEDQGIGLHFELWALRMGGLTNLEALKAATIFGAESLGLQNDLGSIEPGKIADLVILNKNPLEDIHNSKDVIFVMKSGVLYDADSLKEIWPINRSIINLRNIFY